MVEQQTMNEFQLEVNYQIELFWQAAQGKRGRVMGTREVMLVATYISGLTEAVISLENQVASIQNMLAAYVNEYGEDLFNTLTNAPIIEGEIVDDQANVGSTHEAYECPGEGCVDTHTYDSSGGEIIDNEETEENGSGSSSTGLDASSQEEE